MRSDGSPGGSLLREPTDALTLNITQHAGEEHQLIKSKPSQVIISTAFYIFKFLGLKSTPHLIFVSLLSSWEGFRKRNM